MSEDITDEDVGKELVKYEVSKCVKSVVCRRRRRQHEHTLFKKKSPLFKSFMDNDF